MDYISLIAVFIARYLIVVPPLCYLIYFYSTKNKRKLITYTIGILLFTAIFYLIADNVFYNPRPFVSDGIIPLFDHTPDNGFPSNHTLVAAGIAAILSPFSRKISISLWVIALLIGLGRVYSGVHHLIDIFASLVIALVSLTLTYLIVERGRNRF